MQHVEASLVINFTNEYSRFNMLNGNRQLNEGKINRIIKEIQAGNNMLRYYPIQVRENGNRLDILDGQHRYYICRKLQFPVFYILVKEEKSMIDIAKVNSNVEKWKPEDFINCYVQFNNENYKQLQNFMDKYGINLGTSLKLLSTGKPGGTDGGGISLMEDFRNGDFEVKKYDEAVALAELCKNFSALSAWKSRSFIIAINKILEAKLCDINDVIAAHNKRPDFLNLESDYKKYIYSLEQLVNVGKQKRIIIA